MSEEVHLTRPQIDVEQPAELCRCTGEASGFFLGL